jgi:hypothetical protein
MTEPKPRIARVSRACDRCKRQKLKVTPIFLFFFKPAKSRVCFHELNPHNSATLGGPAPYVREVVFLVRLRVALLRPHWLHGHKRPRTKGRGMQILLTVRLLHRESILYHTSWGYLLQRRYLLPRRVAIRWDFMALRTLQGTAQP